MLWALDDDHAGALGLVNSSHKSANPPPPPHVAAAMGALEYPLLNAGDMLMLAGTTLLAWHPGRTRQGVASHTNMYAVFASCCVPTVFCAAFGISWAALLCRRYRSILYIGAQKGSNSRGLAGQVLSSLANAVPLM